MESVGVYNLKEAQQQSILNILHPKQTIVVRETEKETFWKVIIFDQFCSDLLSLQLRIGEIRKYGVTLMLQIDASRQSIDDVPAIYFIQPTKENIEKVLKDINKQMYSSFTLCFTNQLPNGQLELLAEKTCETGTNDLIEKITDGYINYHVLESGLFSLSIQESYIKFNDPTMKEEEAMVLIKYLTDSLFGICLTLKQIPIIRARTGSLENLIAQELVKQLNEFNTENPTYFHRGVSTRPLVLITNRNHDLSAGLLHGWNYQALLDDVANYKFNRVLVDGKWEDIENESQMWKECKSCIIPDVTDTIARKTKELVSEKEKFQIVANSFGLSFDDDVEVSVNEEEKRVLQGQGMAKYGEKMTYIRHLKKEIDIHTSIARMLIEEIKTRDIDLLFSYEDNVMSRIPFEDEAFSQFLNKITRQDDLIRLFYIFLLNDADTTQLLTRLKEKRLKQTQEYLNLRKKEKKQDSSLAGMMSNMFGKVVERLLPSDKNMAVTVLVDTMTECKNSQLEQEYNYYDPRTSIENVLDNRRTIQFKDSIVFVVGGGNYTEYHNIIQYSERTGKRILYGATEMIGGDDLLKQINQIN
ncbi:Sec1 family protein [Entamoeba marina]